MTEEYEDEYSAAAHFISHMHPELIANLVASYIANTTEQTWEEQPLEDAVMRRLSDFYIDASTGLHWHAGKESEYAEKFRQDLELAIKRGEQLEEDYGT